MKPVEFQRLAEQDLFDAIDYYAEHAPQVVARFLDTIDRTIKKIGRSPGIGSLAFADALDVTGLRYQAIGSFPYAVFYQDLGYEVRVIRVLHHGRNIVSLIGLADD